MAASGRDLRHFSLTLCLCSFFGSYMIIAGEKTGTLYYRASGSLLAGLCWRKDLFFFFNVDLCQDGYSKPECSLTCVDTFLVEYLDGAGHWQVGSLAGVAHRLKCNTGVLRAAP